VGKQLDDAETRNEQNLQHVIDLLRDEPLISESMVDEAWRPDSEMFRKFESDNVSEYAPSNSTIGSLTDAAFEPAVRHSIEQKDTSALEKLIWLPGNDKRVLNILRTFDQITDAALPLLRLAIAQHGGHVDLSNLRLANAQVHSIISTMKNPEKVTYLNVSHVAALGRGEVLDILSTLTNLQRLVLYGTAIETKDLATLLVRPCLNELIHPSMFDSPNPVPAAFSIIICSPGFGPGIKGTSTPYLTPRDIVRKVTGLILSMKDSTYSEESKQSVEAALGFTPNEKDPENWGKRSVTHRAEFRDEVILQGEGWTFVVFASRHKTAWAFVKIKSPSKGTSPTQQGLKLQATHHDVRSFLTSISQHGSPAPEDDIVALETAIKEASAQEYPQKVWMNDDHLEDVLEVLAGRRPAPRM
jgi:hypothetical protein